MGKRRSRQFWRGTTAEYEQSGLTAKAFAELRGLNANTLKWWAGRFRREGRKRATEQSPGFVEVAAGHAPLVVSETAGPALGGPAVTIRVGSGVMLAFSELPAAEYVAGVARCYDGVAP